MATTIRLRENGPIVIEGDDVVVIDWNGQPYRVEKRPIALCRCGQRGCLEAYVADYALVRETWAAYRRRVGLPQRR